MTIFLALHIVSRGRGALEESRLWGNCVEGSIYGDEGEGLRRVCIVSIAG